MRVPIPAERTEYLISSNLLGSEELYRVSMRICFAPGTLVTQPPFWLTYFVSASDNWYAL